MGVATARRQRLPRRRGRRREGPGEEVETAAAAKVGVALECGVGDGVLTGCSAVLSGARRCSAVLGGARRGSAVLSGDQRCSV